MMTHMLIVMLKVMLELRTRLVTLVWMKQRMMAWLLAVSHDA